MDAVQKRLVLESFDRFELTRFAEALHFDVFFQKCVEQTRVESLFHFFEAVSVQIDPIPPKELLVDSLQNVEGLLGRAQSLENQLLFGNPLVALLLLDGLGSDRVPEEPVSVLLRDFVW